MLDIRVGGCEWEVESKYTLGLGNEWLALTLSMCAGATGVEQSNLLYVLSGKGSANHARPSTEYCLQCRKSYI